MADSALSQTDITTDITFNDVFDDDDEEELKETPTVHHIRANSSIMQVKKIMGMYLHPGACHWRQLAPIEA
jgi:hypothetical protein